MKKSTKTALIIAAILIIVGGLMVCVAAWRTVGGWKQLFTQELNISGDDFVDWYESHWDIDYSHNGDSGRGGDYSYLTYTAPAEQPVTSVEIKGIARDVYVCQAQPGQALTVDYQENEHERYDIDLSNGALTISGRYSGNNSKGLDGHDLTIYVPEGSVPSIDIYVAAGDVDVEYVSLGQLIVGSAAGDVDINNAAVSGQVSIDCTAGDISLEYTDITGALAVSSLAGSVELSSVSVSGPLGLSTTAGDVSLQWVACDDVTVQALAGDVDCLMEGRQSDYYVNMTQLLESYSFGHEDSGKRLRLQATAGDIELDFTE